VEGVSHIKTKQHTARQNLAGAAGQQGRSHGLDFYGGLRPQESATKIFTSTGVSMFGDPFEQVGRLAPHVRVTRRLNKESRQPNGERSKATRVIRLMKKGEVDCDGKHWAHVYKQLRGNLKAEAMRSCLGQLTSSSLNLSTLANCADAQKIRNILKLGGKGRPCHYCAGDPDSRAAFLAKIWQTMGTPAINAEASQNRRRPAPQAIFFLEGASASESDFA